MPDIEDIRYCTFCGAANKKSATACCACEKNLSRKDSPFATYLKDHIKDNLQDTVNENIFSLIKNFLLSHLYGTFLTVCVVATVAMSAYAARLPAGTERVRLHPDNIEIREQMQADTQNKMTLDEDLDWTSNEIWDEWQSLLDSYDVYVEEIETGSSDAIANDFENIFAQSLPWYNYTSRHAYAENELYNSTWPSAPAEAPGITAGYVWECDSLRYGNNLQTPLGKQLYADGYVTAEVVYTGHVAFCYPETDEELAQKSVFSVPYQFVFVQSGDRWYIASDERI